MQSEILKAQKRDHKSKAPLSEMRKSGWIPGTVYGKDFSPVNFKVNSQKLSKFLAHSGKVFEIEIEGIGKHLVSLEEVQKNHLRDKIMHISFHKIEAKQKLVIKLPVQLSGIAKGTKEGGIVHQVLKEVEVKGFPKDFPEFIDVDVTELSLDNHFNLADIKLPNNLEWAQDENVNLVSCHRPKVKEEATTESVAVTAPVEEIAASESSSDDNQAA